MTQTTPLNLTKDMNGCVTYGKSPSNATYSATLANGVNKEVTVPADINIGEAIITITPGGSIYMAKSADGSSVAAPPAGANFTLTTSQFNPSGVRVNGGDILNFVTTDTACDVSVEFYAQVS